MTHFRVTHHNRDDTIVKAANLVVHDGHLHAQAYSGEYKPGCETLASWPPGEWSGFTQEPKCPECGKDVGRWS